MKYVAMSKRKEVIISNFLINIQLRITEEHTPKIFEINPRYSSTVLYRHLFGFEDLIWSIEDRLGYDLSDYREYSNGRKFYKGFEEYIK